ncbi:hypothetical protein APHAL10511_002118 [Amanita phalloides]|nr:hypothetical protein APHAL10511_002118 [Amanita phalloides]
MSTDRVISPGDGGGASGTAIIHLAQLSVKMTEPTVTSNDAKMIGEGDEQALESHEVIELQTFSERKAWIEDKIKFLERMQPIEVFAGLDAICDSAEQVPGLPTREELQHWIAEHDAIEKETEIFDKGELKKLRQLTKAATQRNLSPEDTDIIELTLTTIYELDRLLHLLRGRTENLELLGIRLTWEENRIAAWGDLRKLIDDLKTFVATRARWTPSVYDMMTPKEDSNEVKREIKRRGSSTSLASTASESSNAPAAFSRGARFKLAELLSRDAAQFASRTSNLRHGRIVAAGKALDKLIDMSRKPVPDVLLDEQDKLEDKGINEMEHVGKFVMSLVMQWRKADEIYVETKKDQAMAQNLLEEIETAKLHHPNARQCTSFISRADGLLKRLSVRGNPAFPTSSFPRPEHFLFLDQYNVNLALVNQLAAEIAHATTLAQNADAVAKDYRKAFDAVKRVEALLQDMENLTSQFVIITDKLLSGVSNDEGDGSPPDLSSASCLEPTAHSVYLALLPDVLDQATKANEAALDLIQQSQSAILALEAPSVDPSFKASARGDVEKFSSQRTRSQAVREDIVGRVYRLKEARRIWAAMGGLLVNLQEIRGYVEEAMEKNKWRQQTTVGGTLTPDSPPGTPIGTILTHSELLVQLGQLAPKLSQDIETPFVVLSYTLEASLKEWFSKSILGLKNTFDAVRQLIQILETIQAQASVMYAIRDECNGIQVSIEDLKIHLKGNIDDVLASRIMDHDISHNEESFQIETKTLEAKVQTFVESLLQRVLFVDRRPLTPSTNSTFVKRRYSALDPKADLSQQRNELELPFELSSLDDAVRADSNSYTITLNGKIESLLHLNAHLKLARMSKEVDNALKPLIDVISSINASLNEQKARFANLGEEGKLKQLDSLMEDVEGLTGMHRTRICRTLSFIRETVRRMQESPGAQDAAVHESLLLSRIRAVDDVELRLNNWFEDINGFKDQIANAHRQESQRLEGMRRSEMQRQQEEARRLAAEEAEKARLKQERLVNEKLRKLEEEKLAGEVWQRLEKARRAAEDAEREMLERRRREAEERRRLEDHRLLEEKRAIAERLRQAAEEAEKARLHRERMEVEVRLRVVEGQLAEERRIAAERAERERVEAEEREKLAKRLLEEREHLDSQMLSKGSKGALSAQELHQLDDVDNFERGIDLSIIVEEPNRSTLDEDEDEDEEEDVFGFRLAPDIQQARSPRMLKLQAQILALRKRLRQIKISDALRVVTPTTPLPAQEKVAKMSKALTLVSRDVARLPSSAEDFTVDTELRSLRTELESSFNLMKRVKDLANFAQIIKNCEAALSDLLEHVDSFPSPPLGVLSTTFRPPTTLPPEKQLTARVTFTRERINEMKYKFALVKDESRAAAECSTVQQTWAELEEMANDRLGGKKTRPSSVIGLRSSPARTDSPIVNARTNSSKKNSYMNLSASTSVASTSSARLLIPPNLGARRAVSGGHETPKPASRPPSQLSNCVTPKAFSPSVYGTTFSSRQRTQSMSMSDSVSTPPSLTPVRSLASTQQEQRSASPAMSESSTLSRSAIGTSKTSTNSSTRSSWSRAPRNSLSSFIPSRSTSPSKAKKPTPPAPFSGPRKKYVPDPKSKLDVAVGDVVNKLPVGINVEGVTDTWKDKSGKYWIGNQDPKLCFCRILRSHTVMVRVGGGWSELSTFIKDHFADSFRIMPDSDVPPHKVESKEKWISSATLIELESKEDQPQVLMVPKSPRTPEPGSNTSIPSFAITTPKGRSPQSASSLSTKSSPLTPMQFIRRADFDSTTGRPVTPSKPPSRARNAPPPTPSQSYSRQGVWRP